MKLSRVLLITKRSAYEIYSENKGKGGNALAGARRAKVKALLASHNEHYRALAEVEKVLDRMNLVVDRIQRDKAFDDEDYDLVLAVGGDGTFISASHFLRTTPILGVNSSPGGSVGFFCGATRRTILRDLERFQQDVLPALSLSRLQVEVGGKITAEPALNDVLYAHEQPAAMSRYELRVDGLREEQKSSGVWIASPAGTGAAVRSAGGRKLPLNSRKFQYVVREPYRHKGRSYRLRKGVLGTEGVLRIESHIGQGKVFIDGPYVIHPISFGTVLQIRLSPYPLQVLGLRSAVSAKAKGRRRRP